MNTQNREQKKIYRQKYNSSYAFLSTLIVLKSLSLVRFFFFVILIYYIVDYNEKFKL